MSKGDIRIVSGPYYVRRFRTEDQTSASRTTYGTIKAGEPVCVVSTGTTDAGGGAYVNLLNDNEPVEGTEHVVGIAVSESTDTSAADGYVDVAVCGPYTVLAAKATTPANIDTQAKLDALQNDRVLIDVVSGKFTLDENAGHGVNNGCLIVGGDIEKGEVHFVFVDGVSHSGTDL